jgi:hypothetical protein
MLCITVPPRLVGGTLPTTIQTSVAKTERFTCRFSGYPSSTVTWFKDSELVKVNGRLRVRDTAEGQRLIISQINGADAGYYQCRASNTAGQAQATALLIVEVTDGAPDSAVLVTAHVESSTCVQLSWSTQHRSNTSNVIAYTAHYLPTDGMCCSSILSVNLYF